MSSSQNKNCSLISSIHLFELFIMVVIGGFFIVWPLAVIRRGWCWKVQRRPRRSKEPDVFVYTILAIDVTEFELSLTLGTWFLCVTHTQWPCFGLFSVSVVPLWCIHVLVIDWEKTFADLEVSHFMLSAFKLQYIKSYKTHSGCVGRSWQQC